MIRFLASVALAAALGLGAVFGSALLRAEDAEDEVSSLPVAVVTEAGKLAALLTAAPFVHKAETGGPVLYVLSFRSCPTCLAFKEAEHQGLLEAGVDVRWIMYARKDKADGTPRSKPGERAMLAEVLLTRSYAEWERWYAMDPQSFYETQSLPPSADDSGPRAALVKAAQQRVADLAGILETNGIDLAIPGLFWQDRASGQWMTSIGYDEATFGQVRASLIGPVPPSQ